MFKSINGGLLPQRATRYSAGFDVFANEYVVVSSGETKLVGLGIAIDEDFFVKRHKKVSSHFFKWAKDRVYSEDEANNMANESADENIDSFKSFHYFELHPRSSLRAKGISGGVGIIDIDYTLEIKMVIHNDVDYFALVDELPNELVINKGDKIGQLILKRHEGWLLPSEYTKDEDRIGGFGSSGN